MNFMVRALKDGMQTQRQSNLPDGHDHDRLSACLVRLSSHFGLKKRMNA
jgi:hypothetical protein